jgi:HD superfamily phosphohydrolase
MENNYRDNYYGSILDPIHGDIKLSEIEKWIISHPLFNRLRRVKQNTFLYYVFPSANHTRFEHSIGVMHIAGKIFDACKENFATGDKKNQKYNESKPSSFFDLRKLNGNEQIYYQELRIAALLHDIGHGPLSHLFDIFLMDKDNFFELIKSNDILREYEESFEAICPEKVEHEHISCVFVFKILNDLIQANTDNDKKFSDSAKEMLDNLSVERVVKLIEPKFILKNKDFIDIDGNNYTNFFSRIITAFPIDADRMDYLLRDSFFSGVNYGFYDINRIFASFMATNDEKRINLTFKGSGIDSMLRFIQSRTHLYNQVYFHKTNRAANTMLEAATRTNKGKTKLLNGKTGIQDLERFYVDNSDEFFINETVKNEISIKGVEQDILEELKSRKLFKRVYEQKIILIPSNFNKKKTINQIVEEIRKKLKNLEAVSIYAYVDMYKNETFKDSDNDKEIKIATKDRASGIYDTKREWVTLNQEFINSNINSYMVRVYIRRTFNNSVEFKSMRNKIIDLIKCECEKLEILE